jgi:predicted nuclease of predicted toxin-antitoxin system
LTAKNEKLKFFLDEGVPDSVARALRDSGHDAVLLRESGVARGSSDQVVCAFAEVSDSILVALDGDMKQLAKDNGVGGGRFKRLNLLKLSCGEPNASKRVLQALSLIEHEWAVDKQERERRLYVEIGIAVIRSYR